MAKTEVGIHHIQKQMDNCDKIVDNIDIIVPKLYKIRQQVLAQRDYVNDITKNLLDKLDTLGTASTTEDAKSLTLNENLNLSTIVNLSGAADIDVSGLDSRKIIQSLFKYKHDLGTSSHFTSEQIGAASDRTDGLNLSDVVNITIGLNDYLASNNTPTNVDFSTSSINKLVLKPSGATESVTPNTNSIINTSVSANHYQKDDTEGFTSLLTGANSGTTIKIVGFGLT